MDVLVAGGHGQIGRRLLRLLAQRGHTARGLIRNVAHVGDLEADGAHPVLFDLEHDDVRPHVGGAEAIVFAAGAGPGSGAARKQTMDLGGAVKLVEAAEKHVVRRYLMLSSMGAGDPGSGSEAMQPYLFAKARADERLQESDLDYTIIRPGSLTEEEGAGRIEAAEALGGRGEIPRDDVARTFAEALEMPNTYRKTFEIIGGETPIREALERI